MATPNTSNYPPPIDIQSSVLRSIHKMLNRLSILFDCSKWRETEQCLKEKLVLLAFMNFILQLTSLLVLLFAFWCYPYLWFSASHVIILPVFIVSLMREWIEPLRYIRMILIIGLITICLSMIYFIFIIGTDPDGRDTYRGANIYSFFSLVFNLPIQVSTIFFLELFIQQIPEDEEE